MGRRYQIPGGPYVGVAEDGRAHQLPGYGFLNQNGIAFPRYGVLNRGPLLQLDDDDDDLYTLATDVRSWL